ncbi:MAG: hypothetical protein OQL28_00895 [Sedimenticola sp.]|nr:hypothetical protein [Sedimenticola sp.]
MLDFIYQTGWGAFTLMLLFQLPFLLVFPFIVYRKCFVDPTPSNTGRGKLTRIETVWIFSAVALFVIANVYSISYMPMSKTAATEASGVAIQDVDVTARSWSYEISDREFEVGKPVRFSVKSVDTMHGFTVYHPNGKILFNMMLIPGLEKASSLVYTFTEPGKYKVRCLEYCGIAHHGMQDELTVVKATDKSS